MTTRTFDTPDPIRVEARLNGGRLRVIASATDVAVVGLRPLDLRSAADREAVEQTTVDLEGGVLRVTAPRRRGLRSWLGSGSSSDITIDVPEGSSLEVDGWVDVVCEGRLADVVIDSAMGSITLDHVATARLKSAMGDVRAARVDGELDARTAMGRVDVGHAGGATRLTTSAGDLSLDVAAGDAELRTAAGSVAIGRTEARLTAKTSAGAIQVASAAAGAVRLESSYGEIEVGIPEGTAAWLDLDAKSGTVATDLASTEAPAPDDRTVEVRVHAHYGDVRIVRARLAKESR